MAKCLFCFFRCDLFRLGKNRESFCVQKHLFLSAGVGQMYHLGCRMMFLKGAFVVSKNEAKSAIGQEFGQERVGKTEKA